MLSNFFPTPTDQKYRADKNPNVEIGSAASSGGQGKYVKGVNFPWLPVEAALSIF
jgi:hypothetical protein